MKNTKRILSGLLVLVMVLALLPIGVFADEAADVSINIAELTNGTVTADKESYKVGDTVTLTVAPNAGYFQKLYIDGQPLMLGWKSKTYSFVAEKESYDITGSFVPTLEMYSGDWGRWDNNNQAHGVFTTYYPNNNDSWWTKVKGEYESISINAKNYRAIDNSYEKGPGGGWRAMLYMQLDNGNYYAFSMWINTEKKYAYNHYGGNIDGVASTTGWNGAWCLVGDKNADAMAALNGDGAEFKLERIDGNHIQVTLDGTVLETYAIPGVTEANKVISVGMQHNGNPGEYINIPFKLTKPSVQVNLPTDLENGSVTADKASYELGDTVTLNINRENGYFQKLYINGEPLMVDWKSNTYSFVAKERVYDITGSFVRSINHTASDWGRWDDYNQGHGILSTYYPNNNDSWWMTFNGEYQSVTVGAKNYLPLADTLDNFMVYLQVTLDNGNNYSFRVYTDKGGYTAYSRAGIQNPGDASADWGKWKNMSNLDSKITTEGVDFKVERTAANELTLTLDGQVVDTYTMNGVTSDNKITNVAVKHQGNQGKRIQVPFYLQAVNAPDAQVIIPAFANGIVTADKESYKVGDTVTLTITPDSGYFQKLYVNGEPILLGWKTFTYSFVATETVMEITGSFEPGASLSPSDWGRWDDHNQAHGEFTTYYPNNNDSWWMAVNGDYQAMTVIAKNYWSIADTLDNFMVYLKVTLDNGNNYSFRVYTDKGGYTAYSRAGIQNPGDAGADWGKWKNMSNLDSKITTEGVDFKVERTAANELTLTLDGQVVDTYTMNGVTSDNKITNVAVKHQGNQGQRIQVPFYLQAVNAPDAQVIIPAFANGTVTADKESYKVGDTVTLTITPNSGYFQKLYVNGEPILLGWKTFTYSFVATETVMEVTGSFEPGASLTPKDWGRWDDHNQAHGQFTTYYPNDNDSWWMAVNGDYQAMTVIAKNYWAIADTLDNFMVNLMVTMDNGNTYNFRVFTDKGGYTAYNRAGIQNPGDASADWSHWTNLSAYDSKITTQGVAYKVERTAANVLTLSVDGQVVDTYTMNGINADNKIASISVKHQGNKGTVVQVPYEMTKRIYDFEVCSATGTVSSYTDLAQALENCGEGQYIKLNKDVTVNATLTKDLYIDLNGFSMTGTIQPAEFKVYGMNAASDSYGAADGKFACGVVPENQFRMEKQGNTYRYMTVKNEDGSYSFHRFYMGITMKSIAPTVTGVGFRAKYYGNEAVKGNIASFGYRLQLGNNRAVIFTKDADQFVTGITGKELTLRVNKWDLVKHGTTELKAAVIMVMKDGTVIEGTTHSLTMQELVEYVNDNLDAFSANQILAVKDMLSGYALDWNIANIVNYTSPTASLYYVNEKKAVVADPFV